MANLKLKFTKIKTEYLQILCLLNGVFNAKCQILGSLKTNILFC